MKTAIIVEEKSEPESVIFRYTLPTPAFMTTREAVIERKTMKDFPQEGAWTIHHKSVEHQDYPENQKKFVRVAMKVNGMVFTDAPEIEGCKLDWVIENDIGGNIPRALL